MNDMPAKKPNAARTLKGLNELQVWGVDDTDSQNYNEGDVGMIAHSIRRYGFNNMPRVWKDNKIRGGNHTVLALRTIKREGSISAIDLQWPPAHVEIRDDDWYIDWIDISHLNETQALGFAIADNRAVERSSKDERLLLAYLNKLWRDDKDSFEASGYDEDDIQEMERFLKDETDLTEFDKVSGFEVKYRVVIEGMERERAYSLAKELFSYQAKVEQYREAQR